MEDEKIIDLYWERSERAIAETERKYGAYCRSIATHILYNQEDSEECVNDTYLRAWNAMPKERPAILSAFLGAITRNLSLDRYRKNHSAKRGGKEVAFVFDELIDCVSKEDGLQSLEEKELVESLNCFLKGLRQEQRVLFLRRYWYMDSIAEIAARYSMSESKVKSILFRTRKKLWEQLQKEGYVL